ncbi:MAG: hypothetical protein R3277_00340 [Brumimicrobium sp.]|nr:hypothetical protein [Brumimicrobium sp.]
MRVSVFILFVSSFLVNPVGAQDKKLKITEFYGLAGFLHQTQAGSSHTDFKSLFPESTILMNNPEAFNNTPEIFSPYVASSGVSILAGFQLGNSSEDQGKGKKTLRLGLTYGRSNILSDWSYSETWSPYDTLTGQNSSNVYYLDSVRSRSVNGDYFVETIGLNASLIFRTNSASRWTAYGGLGLSIGTSFNAITSLNYREYEYTALRGHSREQASETSYTENAFVQEQKRNKGSLNGSLFIPLGIDFRLSESSEFWSMVHIFAEIQPGIRFQHIPEINRSVTQIFNANNLGLRFSW